MQGEERLRFTESVCPQEGGTTHYIRAKRQVKQKEEALQGCFRHQVSEKTLGILMRLPCYVNASQENIAKMFKEAEENAPTIIFIDEINELVPNREGDVHEMSKSAVNEMLAQMDRTGEKGIFIIGATNYPHMIDPAILRAGRLDQKYYVGVPDEVARKALFELYLKNRPYDFGLDYDELSRLTRNYVSADIQLIVNNAARTALKSRSKITMTILRDAIAAVRPSLDITELQRYEEIKAQMNGEEIKKSVNRPKVGFR